MQAKYYIDVIMKVGHTWYIFIHFTQSSCRGKQRAKCYHGTPSTALQGLLFVSRNQFVGGGKGGDVIA